MANARLQVTDLDFDTIKNNLKLYLKQQTTFQDYDFEGSGLNVLLDILAYNTHYNAYYLNMVANESFLDTAVLRDSVVSHAKSMGYVPYSITAPRAVIDVTIDTANTTSGTLTLPRGFNFASELIDNVSYNFVVLDDITVTKSNTSFHFENVDVYQGQLVNYAYSYDSASNPKSVFIIKDDNVDTTTIRVSVTPNPSNTFTEVYSQVTEVLDITSTSKVYFLQEGRDGRYQINFGDGVIGASIPDGSLVRIGYLVTAGQDANKAKTFRALTKLGGYSLVSITTTSAASGGALRESVDSIKYGASSQFTTQNRLVTLKDYESYIKRVYPSVDAVSVWGGEEESPPSYGKVYVSLKPKTDYYISDAEKEKIISEIIGPKSIVSVDAVIREPEYLFLKLENYVEYDKTKTLLSQTALKNSIKNALSTYASTNLNTFDSTFVLSKAQDYIDGVSLDAIRGSETTLRVEKRFTPDFNTTRSYVINFNSELHRGTTTNKLKSTPFLTYDSKGILRTAVIEEIPESFTGVSEIQVTNAGTGFTSTPTVTITGDGTGATAVAKILNGRLVSITVTNRGINYSRAAITITGGEGYGATASAVLDAKYGSLRSVYYDTNAERQVINSSLGSINYSTGQVQIDSLRVISTVADDNLIRVDIEAEKSIIKSNKNTIITIDLTDPTAITTELSEI